MTSRTVTIWIVMDESGDCEVATDKDVAVDRWNDEFLQGDIVGPPEYRFVKLNVTMPARELGGSIPMWSLPFQVEGNCTSSSRGKMKKFKCIT